jgi:hypothetical protein
MSQALHPYGAALLDLYPSSLRGELRDALDEIIGHAVELAREAAQAEAKGLGFAAASRDWDHFPHLARVHCGLVDLLQTEFAVAEQTAIQQVVEHSHSDQLEALRRAWFAVGAEDGELAGPLMRFALYQAIRLNVWVLTWEDGAVLEAGGILDELDDIAERILRARLTMHEMRDPAVRPLHVLVAQALEGVAELWQQRHRELAGSQPEELERFDGLCRAAHVARNLNAGDAALVRNELAGARGGEQLGSRELVQRCGALRSQNATDQRRKRLLARLRTDPNPRAPGGRLIDLLTAVAHQVGPKSA